MLLHQCDRCGAHVTSFDVVRDPSGKDWELCRVCLTSMMDFFDDAEAPDA
jgi:hypothetical protein